MNKIRQTSIWIALISFLLVSFLLSSCDDQTPPKVDYSNRTTADSVTIENLTSDTSKMLVAELPVYFDSTNVLIQPIGLVDLSTLNDRAKIVSRISSNKVGYSESENMLVSNMYTDYISGNMTNLVFEDVTKPDYRKLLTEKAMILSNVQYLREIDKKTKRGYLLYKVYDRDTNKDGLLDGKDIQTLYISNLNGTGFAKVIGEGQEYESGKLILPALRYYIRTIEDTNRDGYFNTEDKYHYYYIDFKNEAYSITEYNPLAIMIP